MTDVTDLLPVRNAVVYTKKYCDKLLSLQFGLLSTSYMFLSGAFQWNYSGQSKFSTFVINSKMYQAEQPFK